MTPIIVAGAVVLSLITVAFILYPVFRASALGRRYITDSPASDRLAELLAQRDAIYEAIRDVDFDRETGKLTAEDHRRIRERLTAEGVRVLQELDRLMQAEAREDLEEEIEREVAALRQARPAELVKAEAVTQPAVEPAIEPEVGAIEVEFTTCYACGGRVRVGARFCTHCGVALTMACPTCEAPVMVGDRFCSRCGAKLPIPAEMSDVVQADSVD